MLSHALDRPRARVPEHSRTLVSKGETVWIWPGIPLTLRRGTEILPIAAEMIRFWITRLHGPEALDKELLRAVVGAARHLAEGNDIAAQAVLDDLRLTELSQDGEVLMRAVADHLGIDVLDLPLRAGMRTWNPQDIAQHLPIFKRHADAARMLAKGAIPFDPQKHPRWPAGAADSHGGEFAPAGGSDAAVIPVASRGSDKPPERGKPKKPSPPLSPDTPGVRYLEPDEFPDGSNSPGGAQAPPKLLSSEDLKPGLGGRNAFTPDEQLPPDAPPPEIPQEPPPDIPVQPLSATARNLFVKAAVRWIARALIVAVAPELAPYLIVLQTANWVAEICWPYIAAYFQGPKTWDELQEDALHPQPGYDIHHPVEQTQAAREGYSKSLWDGPENRLRVPTLKHWRITGWFMRENKNYDGQSPRTYLKGKSWEEKMQVGRDALVKFGVLKP